MLHVFICYILCPNCLASTSIVLTWLVDLARCWWRRPLGWRVWYWVRRLEESQSVPCDPGFWSLVLYTLPPPAINLLELHSDARRAVVFRSHITRSAVIFPPPLLSWVSSYATLSAVSFYRRACHKLLGSLRSTLYYIQYSWYLSSVTKILSVSEKEFFFTGP